MECFIQFLHSVCRPGNREKLRYSQAELGPAIKSAVAYFASISGVANGMQELYTDGGGGGSPKKKMVGGCMKYRSHSVQVADKGEWGVNQSQKCVNVICSFQCTKLSHLVSYFVL